MPADLIARLKLLKPRPSAADPAAAAYTAGVAAGYRSTARWRAAAVLSALAATVPWAFTRPVVRPVPAVAEKVIAAASETAATPGLSSLRRWGLVRDDLLARGLDAIPSTPLPPPPRSAAF